MTVGAFGVVVVALFAEIVVFSIIIFFPVSTVPSSSSSLHAGHTQTVFHQRRIYERFKRDLVKSITDTEKLVSRNCIAGTKGRPATSNPVMVS